MPILAGLFAVLGGAVTWLGSLVTVIIGAISSVIAFLGAYMGARLAIRITMILLFLTMFAVVLAAINGLFSGLTWVEPGNWTMVMSWIIPSNFGVCAAAVISLKTIVYLWSWKKYVFEVVALGN